MFKDLIIYLFPITFLLSTSTYLAAVCFGCLKGKLENEAEDLQGSCGFAASSVYMYLVCVCVGVCVCVCVRC